MHPTCKVSQTIAKVGINHNRNGISHIPVVAFYNRPGALSVADLLLAGPPGAAMVPDPFYFFKPSVYVLACLSYGDKYSYPRKDKGNVNPSERPRFV
jgi:hypothetical protein